MAEAASNVPTFKLVLVGDGGTGKASYIHLVECATTASRVVPIPAVVAHVIQAQTLIPDRPLLSSAI